MILSVRRRISLYSQVLNDDLNDLLTKYYKTKKSYQYWNKRRINVVQKNLILKKLKCVIKKIKITFHKGFQEFNRALLIQRRRIKLLKEHKFFLLQRKLLWNGPSES